MRLHKLYPKFGVSFWRGCLLGSLFLTLALTARAQFPTPLLFDTNNDYDAYFKETPPFDGIVRSPEGFLELKGSSTGTAVFDSSTDGGAQGNGGDDGSDFDDYFEDLTFASWISCSDYHAPFFRVGYLIRLDENEANGYLVQITSSESPEGVFFQVYEGASTTESGTRIYQQFLSLDWGTLAVDTNYAFKVSIASGTFTMDFANGMAHATFTDPSVSTLSGQIGILLATANPFMAVRMDSLSVVEGNTHPPSDVQLMGSSVEENDQRITEVGRFQSLDPDILSNAFSYALIAGDGDTGNNLFSIDGDLLYTSKSFNYEAGDSYSIRVRSMDADNEFLEQIFIIDIIDQVESPFRTLDFYREEKDHYILKWPLDAGYNYQVQESLTLLPDSWTDRGDPVVAEDGESLVRFHLRTESTAGLGFFRVIRSESP